MICKLCPEGRRFAGGSVYCLLYGIVIREDHECCREGGKRHDGEFAGELRDGENGAGLSEDSGHAAERMPDVFQRAGERADIFGLEEWPED